MPALLDEQDLPTAQLQLEQVGVPARAGLMIEQVRR
jgi:hypothetical protein